MNYLIKRFVNEVKNQYENKICQLPPLNHRFRGGLKKLREVVGD